MTKNIDKALMEKFKTIYVLHVSKESMPEFPADKAVSSCMPGRLGCERGVEE
jgi:hypothetical protein